MCYLSEPSWIDVYLQLDKADCVFPVMKQEVNLHMYPCRNNPEKWEAKIKFCCALPKKLVSLPFHNLLFLSVVMAFFFFGLCVRELVILAGHF